MSDWRYRLAQNRGTLLAFVFFVVMFAIYCEQSSGRLHRQCRADRGQQGRAAGAGGDGADVRRHHRRHRSFGRHGVRSDQLPGLVDRGRHGHDALRSASSAFSLTGLACGAINGLIVIYGRLQPIVATIASGAVFFGVALLLRPVPGGDVYGPLADALTGRIFGVVPASLVCARRRRSRRLGSLSPIGDRPRGLRRRLVGDRGLYVGRAGRRRQVLRLPSLGIWPLRSAGCF